MKFIKKVAALCFCAALALSVMAVSAMATDDATTYTVKLEQASADGHTKVDSSHTYIEYDQGHSVVYDIKLYADTDKSVSAVNFKLPTPDPGLSFMSITSDYVTGTFNANTDGEYTLNLTTTTDGATTAATVGSNGLTIATVTYTVANNAVHDTTPAFSVSDVVIHEVDTTIDYKPTTGSVLSVNIMVDPEYTVSVYNPASNTTTGVISDKEAPDTNTTAVAYTYTMFNGNNTTFAALTGFNGYTFLDKFRVYETVGTWTAGNEPTTSDSVNTLNNAASGGDTASAVQNNKWGNVTLVAQYQATEYTVTYNLNEETAAGAAISGTAPAAKFTDVSGNTPATLKYTIESAVTTDTDAKTNFGIASRNGYDFNGWKVEDVELISGDTTSNITQSFWSTAFTGNTLFSDYATQIPNKAFGNLTLKADWTIIGERKELTYQYAGQTVSGTNDVLILFAVQDKVDNVARATGTYKCVIGDISYDMFILNGPTTAQENDSSSVKYAQLFGNKTDTETRRVSDSGWTIYGYIAPAGSKITFTSADNDTNDKIDYTGDVNNNSYVNAVDYGLAIDLLAGLGNYDYSALNVKARLMAHVDANAIVASGQTNAGALGTIEDVAAIMAKVSSSALS